MALYTFLNLINFLGTWIEISVIWYIDKKSLLTILDFNWISGSELNVRYLD